MLRAESVGQDLLASKTDSEAMRTDIQISGIYPHLTVYGIYSQNGGHFKEGHNEAGIGAIVPWSNRLWMVSYAPHMPKGSEHKLHSINDRLEMTIHPESVGGTPAGRMIHRESNQLLIGHYLVDSSGTIRTISPEKMPIRITAIARHLAEPAQKVYYIDMEGSIWEADVESLDVRQLFRKPVPGWHGKGGYTSQGRLVISNNGELPVGNYQDLLVGGPSKNQDEAGVLAEWDGREWKMIERKQFTDVTGPGGIYGSPSPNSPLWSMGWDRRSVRLKLLEDGVWHTYLLPKASHCNDARHGWYTEWPRIREITQGRFLMDMHGMFYEFPKSFSSKDTSGLRPISSHLRYVPDFCEWNGRLVLATDETSIQENKLAGQPQSNLWFGTLEDLKEWGPASGYGGPWVQEEIVADQFSDPFLIAGFEHRVLHLVTEENAKSELSKRNRVTGEQEIVQLPRALQNLPLLTISRGDWHKPASGFTFRVDRPSKVYLAVDNRGSPSLDASWKRTDLRLVWGSQSLHDTVYVREFPAGPIVVPGNATEHQRGSFGMPHAVFVDTASESSIVPGPDVTIARVPQSKIPSPAKSERVTFTLQVDEKGDGEWKEWQTITLDSVDSRCLEFPRNFEGTWFRLKGDKKCLATAYLHQTSSPRVSNSEESQKLFDGIAEVDQKTQSLASHLYAAKENRNLKVVHPDISFEFQKGPFTFREVKSNIDLQKLLSVTPDFRIDEASVIVEHQGIRRRLPKGNHAFDQPFELGWPRGSREVESERHLANIHGTFYEIPLILNGQPPAWDLIRPVASHTKKITDFCSWNGLLVLSGIRSDAVQGGHVFIDPSKRQGLWFGGIDDLWKLGKPRGVGGPWKGSSIQKSIPSDPYLMTGYDVKKLTLDADQDVSMMIEIDIDHQSGWHPYKRLELKKNQTMIFEFPRGFSAHWVRLVADQDCVATATFLYE